MCFKKTNSCVLFFFCSLLVLVSCDEINKSFLDTLKEAPEPTFPETVETPAISATETATSEPDFKNLQQAEDALKSLPEFKGKPVVLYNSVHFYTNGNILLKVQDVENSNYINEYFYQKGQWEGPKPVQLSKSEEAEISEKIFPLKGFPFITAGIVLANYNEKAKNVAGAIPTKYVYFIFNNDYSWWYPTSINGERKRWEILFEKDGSIKKFERK